MSSTTSHTRPDYETHPNTTQTTTQTQSINRNTTNNNNDPQGSVSPTISITPSDATSPILYTLEQQYHNWSISTFNLNTKRTSHDDKKKRNHASLNGYGSFGGGDEDDNTSDDDYDYDEEGHSGRSETSPLVKGRNTSSNFIHNNSDNTNNNNTNQKDESQPAFKPKNRKKSDTTTHDSCQDFIDLAHESGLDLDENPIHPSLLSSSLLHRLRSHIKSSQLIPFPYIHDSVLDYYHLFENALRLDSLFYNSSKPIPIPPYITHLDPTKWSKLDKVLIVFTTANMVFFAAILTFLLTALLQIYNLCDTFQFFNQTMVYINVLQEYALFYLGVFIITTFFGILGAVLIQSKISRKTTLSFTSHTIFAIILFIVVAIFYQVNIHEARLTLKTYFDNSIGNSPYQFDSNGVAIPTTSTTSSKTNDFNRYLPTLSFLPKFVGMDEQDNIDTITSTTTNSNNTVVNKHPENVQKPLGHKHIQSHENIIKLIIYMLSSLAKDAKINHFLHAHPDQHLDLPTPQIMAEDALVDGHNQHDWIVNDQINQKYQIDPHKPSKMKNIHPKDQPTLPPTPIPKPHTTPLQHLNHYSAELSNTIFSDYNLFTFFIHHPVSVILLAALGLSMGIFVYTFHIYVVETASSIALRQFLSLYSLIVFFVTITLAQKIVHTVLLDLLKQHIQHWVNSMSSLMLYMGLITLCYLTSLFLKNQFLIESPFWIMLSHYDPDAEQIDTLSPSSHQQQSTTIFQGIKKFFTTLFSSSSDNNTNNVNPNQVLQGQNDGLYGNIYLDFASNNIQTDLLQHHQSLASRTSANEQPSLSLNEQNNLNCGQTIFKNFTQQQIDNARDNILSQFLSIKRDELPQLRAQLDRQYGLPPREEHYAYDPVLLSLVIVSAPPLDVHNNTTTTTTSTTNNQTTQPTAPLSPFASLFDHSHNHHVQSEVKYDNNQGRKNTFDIINSLKNNPNPQMVLEMISLNTPSQPKVNQNFYQKKPPQASKSPSQRNHSPRLQSSIDNNNVQPIGQQEDEFDFGDYNHHANQHLDVDDLTAPHYQLQSMCHNHNQPSAPTPPHHNNTFTRKAYQGNTNNLIPLQHLSELNNDIITAMTLPDSEHSGSTNQSHCLHCGESITGSHCSKPACSSLETLNFDPNRVHTRTFPSTPSASTSNPFQSPIDRGNVNNNNNNMSDPNTLTSIATLTRGSIPINTLDDLQYTRQKRLYLKQLMYQTILSMKNNPNNPIDTVSMTLLPDRPQYLPTDEDGNRIIDETNAVGVSLYNNCDPNHPHAKFHLSKQEKLMLFALAYNYNCYYIQFEAASLSLLAYNYQKIKDLYSIGHIAHSFHWFNGLSQLFPLSITNSYHSGPHNNGSLIGRDGHVDFTNQSFNQQHYATVDVPGNNSGSLHPLNPSSTPPRSRGSFNLSAPPNQPLFVGGRPDRVGTMSGRLGPVSGITPLTSGQHSGILTAFQTQDIHTDNFSLTPRPQQQQQQPTQGKMNFNQAPFSPPSTSFFQPSQQQQQQQQQQQSFTLPPHALIGADSLMYSSFATTFDDEQPSYFPNTLLTPGPARSVQGSIRSQQSSLSRQEQHHPMAVFDEMSPTSPHFISPQSTTNTTTTTTTTTLPQPDHLGSNNFGGNPNNYHGLGVHISAPASVHSNHLDSNSMGPNSSTINSEHHHQTQREEILTKLRRRYDILQRLTSLQPQPLGTNSLRSMNINSVNDIGEIQYNDIVNNTFTWFYPIVIFTTYFRPLLPLFILITGFITTIFMVFLVPYHHSLYEQYEAHIGDIQEVEALFLSLVEEYGKNITQSVSSHLGNVGQQISNTGHELASTMTGGANVAAAIASITQGVAQSQPNLPPGLPVPKDPSVLVSLFMVPLHLASSTTRLYSITMLVAIAVSSFVSFIVYHCNTTTPNDHISHKQRYERREELLYGEFECNDVNCTDLNCTSPLQDEATPYTPCAPCITTTTTTTQPSSSSIFEPNQLDLYGSQQPKSPDSLTRLTIATGNVDEDDSQQDHVTVGHIATPGGHGEVSDALHHTNPERTPHEDNVASPFLIDPEYQLPSPHLDLQQQPEPSSAHLPRSSQQQQQQQAKTPTAAATPHRHHHHRHHHHHGHGHSNIQRTPHRTLGINGLSEWDFLQKPTQSSLLHHSTLGHYSSQPQVQSHTPPANLRSLPKRKIVAASSSSSVDSTANYSTFDNMTLHLDSDDGIDTALIVPNTNEVASPTPESILPGAEGDEFAGDGIFSPNYIRLSQKKFQYGQPHTMKSSYQSPPEHHLRQQHMDYVQQQQQTPGGINVVIHGDEANSPTPIFMKQTSSTNQPLYHCPHSHHHQVTKICSQSSQDGSVAMKLDAHNRTTQSQPSLSTIIAPTSEQQLVLAAPPEQRIVQERSIQSSKPVNFVNLRTFIPSLQFEIRYSTTNNFTNSVVEGYNTDNPVYFTTEAAIQLKQVQEYLEREHNYTLKVFDTYRPFTSVQYFVKWSTDQLPRTDEQKQHECQVKEKYYPDIDTKQSLFDLGYIAHFSGHCRGSTLDLTIVDKATGTELEMGTVFDFFGKESHHFKLDETTNEYTPPLSTFNFDGQNGQLVFNNRELFRNIMDKFGFKQYDEEWWHYTLKDEPYPDTFFDFLINPIEQTDPANQINHLITLPQIQSYLEAATRPSKVVFVPTQAQLDLLNTPPVQQIISQRIVQSSKPLNFVNLRTFIPSLIYEIRYTTTNNFTNSVVEGYNTDQVVYLTTEAAIQLQKVQEYLEREYNYTLKVFDTYRPYTSVQYFVKWSTDKLKRTKAQNKQEKDVKKKYYPDIETKQQLFDLGYIAHFSGHCRGSTLDLTIVDKTTGEELQMGTIFDFFGKESHHFTHDDTTNEYTPSLSTFNFDGQNGQVVLKNRQFFKDTMKKFGFKHYDEEWWHYTLDNEPYPDTFFDFMINPIPQNDPANKITNMATLMEINQYFNAISHPGLVATSSSSLLTQQLTVNPSVISSMVDASSPMVDQDIDIESIPTSPQEPICVLCIDVNHDLHRDCTESHCVPQFDSRKNQQQAHPLKPIHYNTYQNSHTTQYTPRSRGNQYMEFKAGHDDSFSPLDHTPIAPNNDTIIQSHQDTPLSSSYSSQEQSQELQAPVSAWEQARNEYFSTSYVIAPTTPAYHLRHKFLILLAILMIGTSTLLFYSTYFHRHVPVRLARQPDEVVTVMNNGHQINLPVIATELKNGKKSNKTSPVSLETAPESTTQPSSFTNTTISDLEKLDEVIQNPTGLGSKVSRHGRAAVEMIDDVVRLPVNVIADVNESFLPSAPQYDPSEGDNVDGSPSDLLNTALDNIKQARENISQSRVNDTVNVDSTTSPPSEEGSVIDSNTDASARIVLKSTPSNTATPRAVVYEEVHTTPSQNTSVIDQDELNSIEHPTKELLRRLESSNGITQGAQFGPQLHQQHPSLNGEEEVEEASLLTNKANDHYYIDSNGHLIDEDGEDYAAAHYEDEEHHRYHTSIVVDLYHHPNHLIAYLSPWLTHGLLLLSFLGVNTMGISLILRDKRHQLPSYIMMIVFPTVLAIAGLLVTTIFLATLHYSYHNLRIYIICVIYFMNGLTILGHRKIFGG